MRQDRVTLITTSGTHAIGVRIAVTHAEQQAGLKFVRSLPDDAGMLFLYRPPREVTMWMLDTWLSLDMVFIGAGGAVHRIEARTRPGSRAIIPSRGEVIAVLELAAGSAERLGLRAGDMVEHPALAHGT